MKTKRDRIIEQIELMEIIREKANINIVDCGNCGSIFLHKRIVHSMDGGDEHLNCPYCEREMDESDCPDFLYWGIENNAEFED